MALGIPLPGDTGEAFLKGTESGGQLFSRLMQPRLQREHMAQQKEFAAQQLQKQMQFHQDEMALRQAAAQRAAAMDPMRQMILQQQLLGLKNKNDPMYQIKQFQNLAKMFGGQQQGESPRPTQEMGEGMGMFSPQGLEQQAQEPMQNTQQPGEFNVEALRQNPMLRGFFKHTFGYDPLGAEKGSAYQGAAREAYDLERLRKEVGEDNPIYQSAKHAYESSIRSKEDLSNLRGRTLGGLKPGERWFNDEQSGEVLGKEIPLTATERQEHTGRGFFNYVFPHISQGLSEFSGKGSIRKLQDAASRYNADPEAKRLIDDYYLGKKLLTAGVVKEASTLASGKQKSTYQQLKESLNSSDVPDKIGSLIKQFGLTSEVNKNADQRFQQILNEATEAGHRAVPAFQKQYFHPEKMQQEAKSMQMNNMESAMVPMISPSGKRVMIPSNQVGAALASGGKHA